MRVSAAEFVRHFGEMREKAVSEPIIITSHGRETHILCNAETFQRLSEGTDDTAPSVVHRNTDSLLFELANWIDEGIIACDDHLTVRYANHIAHSIAGALPGSLIELPLSKALPAIAGGLVESQMRRTLRIGEPNLMDIPSPFQDDAWLRVHTFRLDHRVILRLRDITIETERHFKANVKDAIVAAMDAHGEISYARVSARGTIDRVDEPFEKLVGLTAERLNRVLISDLVAAPDKPKFRDCLDRVMRGMGPERLVTRLISNLGSLTTVNAAFARLEGQFGIDGAVVVFTRHGGVYESSIQTSQQH